MWMTSELTKSDGTTTPSRRTPPIFGASNTRYNHPERQAYGSVRWAAEQDDLHPSDKKDLRRKPPIIPASKPRCSARAGLQFTYEEASCSDNLRAEPHPEHPTRTTSLMVRGPRPQAPMLGSHYAPPSRGTHQSVESTTHFPTPWGNLPTSSSRRKTFSPSIQGNEAVPAY